MPGQPGSGSAELTGEIDPGAADVFRHSSTKGKALYEYARKGVEIERASRRVTFTPLTSSSWLR